MMLISIYVMAIGMGLFCLALGCVYLFKDEMSGVPTILIGMVAICLALLCYHISESESETRCECGTVVEQDWSYCVKCGRELANND